MTSTGSAGSAGPTADHGSTSSPGEQIALHYRVELVFEAKPELDQPSLLKRLGELGVDDLSPLSTPADSGIATDAEADADVVLQGPRLDTGTPPHWRIGSPRAWRATDCEDALSQSWWWPECEVAIQPCRWAVPISDAHMVGLDYKERLRRIQQVTVAAVLAFEPAGLHWIYSEQFLEPRAFADSVRQDDFRSPLPGGLHVRFFRLEHDGSPGGTGHDAEYLMDTRGLTALGLVDLQCHFRGLDPEDVSHVLYSTGNYLFDQGRVIVPGNTVQGPGPRDAWLVRSTTALGPPEREVLDLDPGFPFAAGDYDDEDGPSEEH